MIITQYNSVTNKETRNEIQTFKDLIKDEVKSAQIFDFYDIGKILGEGSFAQVMIATSNAKHRIKFKERCGTNLPEIVAIKRIEKNNLVTAEGVSKEVQLLREVSCDQVVAFFERFENSEYYFLVMECMQGGELFDYIVERNFLNESEAASIVKQVALGLCYMHSLGVVHRDIKPENILFVEKASGSKVKLTDFGLAEKTSTPQASNLTSPCGTPGYVAPEILQRKPYGAKVDIWSLGVILYILLCGYPPFYSDDQAELFQQIKNGDYSFGEPYWTDISQQGKSTISKILTVDPIQRVSAKELLQMPWVRDDTEQNKQQLGLHVVEGIKEVRQDKRLQKVAIAITVINAFKREKNIDGTIVKALKSRRQSTSMPAAIKIIQEIQEEKK